MPHGLAQPTWTLDETVLNEYTLISGVNIPWELTWGPDDMLWCTPRRRCCASTLPQGVRHRPRTQCERERNRTRIARDGPSPRLGELTQGVFGIRHPEATNG